MGRRDAPTAAVPPQQLEGLSTADRGEAPDARQAEGRGLGVLRGGPCGLPLRGTPRLSTSSPAGRHIQAQGCG